MTIIEARRNYKRDEQYIYQSWCLSSSDLCTKRLYSISRSLKMIALRLVALLCLVFLINSNPIDQESSRWIERADIRSMFNSSFSSNQNSFYFVQFAVNSSSAKPEFSQIGIDQLDLQAFLAKSKLSENRRYSKFSHRESVRISASRRSN